MRLYYMIHCLVEKFAPMDERSKSELLQSATNAYNETKEESMQVDMENERIDVWNKSYPDDQKIKVPKNWKLKAVDLCEQWWMRYLFAIGFVVLVPIVKNWFFSDSLGGSGEDAEPDEFEEDEEDSLIDQLLMRKRKKLLA